MASRVADAVRKRFATQVEQKFFENLLWLPLVNTAQQALAQNADFIDILRPDSSAIVKVDANLTDGGTNASSWTNNTRNLEPPTAREMTTSGQRMYLREVYRDAIKIGSDDLYDSSVDLISAGTAAVARLQAEVVDEWIADEWIAKIPAGNSSTYGGDPDYITAAGAVNGNQDLILDLMQDAQFTMRMSNIIDTGTRDYRPWMLMHPAHWKSIQNNQLALPFLTDEYTQARRGTEIRRGRVAQNLLGFDVYVSTAIKEIKSTDPDHIPLYFGHSDAFSFARTQALAHVYAPGENPSAFGWSANYKQRFGGLMIWDDLAFRRQVASNVAD